MAAGSERTVGDSVPQRTPSFAYSASMVSGSFSANTVPHFAVAAATSSFGSADAIVAPKLAIAAAKIADRIKRRCMTALPALIELRHKACRAPFHQHRDRGLV